MNKNLTIEITAEDAKNACRYTNIENCLLATAVKRQINGCVYVGPRDVIISRFWGLWQTTYNLTREDARRIQYAYDASGIRIRPGFKPFAITVERA